MNTDAGVPPIVLFVAVQEPRDGSFVDALEEAGFWIARSGSPRDALRDIAELRPDVVVAPEGIVRTLTAGSAVGAVPVVVLEDAPDTPALRSRIERALATSRESRERATLPEPTPVRTFVEADRRATARTCPSCGEPLVWAEQRTVGGVEYDYYRWCAAGCGLYCFELSTNRWLKLA